MTLALNIFAAVLSITCAVISIINLRKFDKR